MKRFTLLLFFLCTIGFSFGQVLQTASDAPVKAKPLQDGYTNPKAVKGGGDIIWQTTFNWADPSSQQGWTLPAGWTVMDNTDKGNLWKWKDDTLGAYFVKIAPPAWFESKSDGYICLPMDEYNYRDGIATQTVMDSYIQTPEIDCSNASSVVVKFNQYFRYCCKNYNLEMMVTNDAGVHWATYDVKFGTAGNLFTPERFRKVEINITDVAAGLSTVQIRFYIHGPYEYFWMIDDLKLTEAFQNDLVMEDYWLNFDNGAGSSLGQINYWPMSQMGMTGTQGTVGNYKFQAAFLNNGANDAEDAELVVNVRKDGSQIFTDHSVPSTIWSLERDTQAIDNPYLCSDYGDYSFDFVGSTTNGDDVMANNQKSVTFTVNDTMSFRSDFTAESLQDAAFWSGGGGSGNMLATAYTTFTSAEVNSMTAYIGDFEVAENPQFQFILCKVIDGSFEEWVSSDVVDMDSTYMNRLVTLPIVKDGETEFLEPGGYLACVKTWGVTATGGATSGMTIGRDLTTRPYACKQYQSTSGSWSSLTGDPLFMIGFNQNTKGGPTKAPVTFNVDMTKHIASGEFKPGIDVVTAKGPAGIWDGSVTLTDPDGDGIYSATVADMTIAKVINYKYCINGVQEAYPTTGNAYRSFTVRYWNVINDVYNGGITTGIDTKSMIASFNVYPNPTTGAFTLEIANQEASDLTITLTNIQGQVVYTNRVENVVNYQESINNQLSKGVYFLSVNNGKEVKVQKVVVQ